MKKLLLLLILASAAAYAVDYDISEGSVSIKSGGKYTVTGSTTENSIDIDTADDVEITLDNVSITDVESSFRINRGNVTLILVGSNTLDVWEDPGIYVGASAALTISAESTGSLTIKNFTDTGIGGRRYGTSGPITINGGTLKIDSYSEAAIGGGREGTAGTVIIKGGTVKAKARSGGAGIGCGRDGGASAYPAGTVIIEGGTVEAYGEEGAGIGAGDGRGDAGRGPNVFISGGSVKASSKYGSPIGPGEGAGLCPTPLNWDHGEAIYKAVLEGAMADSILSIFGAGGIVSFTGTRTADGLTYSYEGEGHSGTDDLYFYLPEGDYTITGSNGKTYAGSVSSSGSTIVPTPEPAIFGFLALAILAFRRKM